MLALDDLFQDYAPPNAADYRARRAGLAQAVAGRHARLGDRLQHRSW